MKIELIKKEGSLDTVSVDGIKLHSAYSPDREAQRFVDSLECPFTPSHVLVTGPALSYCADFLRKRFPKAKLCCVHYDSFFTEYDGAWDRSFLYKKDSCPSLSAEIYNYMGEEGIGSCLFASWKPSEKVFPDEYTEVWSEIKSAVIKGRNVLATMAYFSKRWTKNSIRFCLLSRKNAYIQKGSAPVVVCASGPSLKSSIPMLIENRKSFFLIAVSSAVRPLLENKIIPDLILSTDGGYWAKQHLSFAMENDYDIPLALPPEAACYGKEFSQTVVPLSYGDGCGEDLLKECGYPMTRAMRNGTVSGTAARLALDITSGNVFFCGLDLSPSRGFTHTQPNELEATNSIKDFRLATRETRLAPSGFQSPALDTYRDWFSSADFGGRLFRLSNGYSYSNSLGKTKDVDWDFFKKSNTGKLPKPNLVFTENKIGTEERKGFVMGVIKKHLHDEEWIKNIFPSEYIAMERAKGTQMENDCAQKINGKIQSFSLDIEKYLGSGK